MAVKMLLSAAAAVVIASSSTLGAIILGGDSFPAIVRDYSKPDDGDDPEVDGGIHFYNWDNPADRKYNFGPDGFAVIDQYAKPQDELLDRITYDGDGDPKLPDPALMAAIAYAIDQKHNTNYLAQEWAATSKAGEVVNAACADLMSNADRRKQLAEDIKSQFDQATITVADIGDYKSMMWQVSDGFADRPAITIADSHHHGGHALVIEWENGDVLKLRFECGYQPMDVEFTPTSTEPPHTTPTQPHTEPTTKTTTLVPKDTKQAVKVDSDPDNGRGTGTATAATDVVERPVWTPETRATTPSTTPTQSAV